MKKIVIWFSAIICILFTAKGQVQENGPQKSLTDQATDFAMYFYDSAAKKIKEIDLKDLWTTFAFPQLKQWVIDDVVERNADRYRPAQAYKNTKPLKFGFSLEGNVITNRSERVRKAYAEVTKTPISKKDAVPKVGCVFSGGGYRAMTTTAGYLKGFEDLGILNTVMYFTALSGSTWYVGPWILQQQQNKSVSIAAYNDLLRQKIRDNTFNPLGITNAKSFRLDYAARDALFPKIVFEQPLSSVDMYGMILAHALLKNFGDQAQRQHLSLQYAHIQDGNAPWPIYTAVSMHKMPDEQYRYNWYEFNPEEVRNLEQNLAIPSFAFGRKFSEGKSQDFAPEFSFGFLMGIFGSAYAINIKDMQQMFFAPAKDASLKEGESLVASLYEKAKKGDYAAIWKTAKDAVNLDEIRQAILVKVVQGLVDELAKSSVGTLRAAPAQIRNPFKGFIPDNQWLNDREILTFIDAGLDCNVPLLPLLRPDRKLDVIFVCDASETPESEIGKQLIRALEDVKRLYGISYTREKKLSDKVVHVYRPDKEHQHAPIIEYITFFGDNDLLEQELKNPQLRSLIENNNLLAFDGEKCMSEKYCGTFNFNYTEKDFNQLSAMAEFNVKAHMNIHKQIMQERLKVEEEFSFGGH